MNKRYSLLIKCEKLEEKGSEIIINNTYFLVSLHVLAVYALGDAFLDPLTDEVRLRPIYDDLNNNRTTRDQRFRETMHTKG